VKARRAAPAPAPEFKSPDPFGVRYGLGSGGGDRSCPTGMVEMLIAGDTCERAAAVAGRPYSGTVNLYMLIPRGCAWYSVGGSFYFNDVDYGAAHASFQPVCAGAPGSRKQQHQSSANVCVPVCVCVGVALRARACVRACMRARAMQVARQKARLLL
jgi:hypothetical protein